MKNFAKPTRKSQSREAMLLTELVDLYIDSKNADRPLGHELSPRTKSHYVEVVQVFKRYLGRDATVGDLTTENLNGFLVSELKAGRSAYSVKNRRTGLMALWRFAKREKLTRRAAEGVRTVRCQALDPRGYSEQEMEALVAAAYELRGVVRRNGIRKSTYWVSLLLVMWDLGLRAGDVVKIEVAHFDSTGRLFVLEHKTRKNGWHQLRPMTFAAVKACVDENPVRELIWPGHKIRNFCRAFKALAAAAGLPGTSRWTRRGSGSAVERDRPGSGWRFLNHSTPSVFENHYRDARICDVGIVGPPEVKLSQMVRDSIVGEPMVAEPPAADEQGVNVTPSTPQKPSDVTLTDEAKSALLVFEFTGEELGALVDCLAAQGVSQRQLAEWWGVKFKFYQNMRYGYKRIPTSRAAKLRRLFGVKREVAPKKFVPVVLDSFTIVA